MAWDKLKAIFKKAKPELTDAEIDEAIAEMDRVGGQPPTPLASAQAAVAPTPATPQAEPAIAVSASTEISQLLAENRQLRQEVSSMMKTLGEMKTRDDAAQKVMQDRAKEEREKAMKSKADEYIKAGKWPEAKRAELEADLIADVDGRITKHYDAMPANPAVNRPQAPAANPTTPTTTTTNGAAPDKSQRASAALAEIAASMPTN